MKLNTALLFSLMLLLTACKETSRAVDFYSFENCDNAMVYEVPEKALSITIENIPLDTTLYITKTNETKKIISKDNAQYITSTQGITLNTKQSGQLSENFLTAPSSDFTPPKTFTKQEKLLTFDKAQEKLLKQTKKSVEKSYTTGNQKDIYIDVNSEMSVYKKKSAHLAAAGTYCYVWIIDDYYTENLAQSAIRLSEAFNNMYQPIRNIFGKESDEMFGNYNGEYFEQKPMQCISVTGTKINIVLYDIGMKNNGLVGYFSSKDYFPQDKDYATEILKYSNAGKYIYIDSQWAEADAEMCRSTLAHEFQHMIQYNQKTLKHKLVPDNAFNEMMALICEDLMQPKANNENLNSRLALFNTGYAECGFEYRSESHYHAMLSYSVTYTFGAWLFNKYGGTELIHKMATNSYSGTKAITKATGKSMKELLKQFSIDCVSKSKDSSFMWNLHKTDYDTEGYKYDGPLYYPYNTHHEIRPYGIVLVKVGKAEDTTVSLKFNKKDCTCTEHTYIVAVR